MPSRQRLQPRRLDAASVAALAAFATLYVVAAVLHRVPPWANLLYSGASLLACVFYTVDKAAARAGRDRICEAMLLWLGLVGRAKSWRSSCCGTRRPSGAFASASGSRWPATSRCSRGSS